MGKSEINVLTGLETTKVALVKRGANRKPRFPITKSEDTPMDGEIVKAILEIEAEGESKIGEIFKGDDLSEKGEGAVKAALRLLDAYKDELPKGAIAKIAELSGHPIVKADTKKEEEERMKKEAEAKAAAAKAAAAKKAKSKDNDDGFPFPMAKALAGLPDELRETMTPIFKAMEIAHTTAITKAEEDAEKAKAEREEIAKTLETERSERKTKEWIAKADTDLSHFPGKSSEELGEMLKGLEDHDPELAKSQFESMKSASDAIKKSDLLVQAGVPGAITAGSASEKIAQMAEQLIAKSDKPMSPEAAEAEVLKQNPELYDEYLNENPSQTGQRR